MRKMEFNLERRLMEEAETKRGPQVRPGKERVCVAV